MKKRLLSLALVVTMICSFFTAIPVSAASMFSDVNGHWAQATIEELASKGIVNGKGAGLYDPEGKVTRAEFSKLLMCIVESNFKSVEGELIDVPKDAWFNPYVYAAFDRSIFYLNELDSNQFMPNNQADRETVAVWAVRLLGIEGESAETPFVDSSLIENKVAVATAYNYGIVSGDGGTGKFRPDDPLTRAEAATIIKRVMVKYQEINGVRPSKNIIDYDDGLNEVTASTEHNILSEADQDAGKFVFTNINDEIKNLKTGDLFIIKPCEAIPSGIAIKVKEITINGSTATIKQGDISLADVVDEIDVSQQTEITMDNLVEGSLGEGVTVTYNNQDVTKDYLADASGELLAEAKDMKLPLDISFNLDYKITDNAKLTGSIALSDLVITSDIEFDGVTLKTLKLTETHKTEINVELSGSLEYDALAKDGFLGNHNYKGNSVNEGQYTSGSNTNRKKLQNQIFNAWKDKDITDVIKKPKGKNLNYKDVKLASFNFPVGTTGIFGIIDFRFTMEGKLEASGRFSFSDTKTTGISYTKASGLTKVNQSKDKETDLVIAGVGEVKLGAQARAGFTFLYVLTLDFGVGAGVGAKVSTEIEVFDIKFDDVPNDGTIASKITLLNQQVKNDQVTKGDVHACDLCFDGRIYIYLTLDAKCEVGAGIFTVTLFNPKWDILNDNNARLLSGYLSVDLTRENPIEAAWSKCPYNYSAPKIHSQSESKKCKIGDDLTLHVNNTSEANGFMDTINTAVANGWGNRHDAVKIYQWYKDGMPITDATDNIYQLASLKETDAGVYNCIVALKENPDFYTVSKDIKIEIDTNTLTGGTTSSTTAKSTAHTGKVSEENPKSTFSYTAPVTGKYYFVNGGSHKVFINVDGTYRTNEGHFDLQAGRTYTVSVEWYLDNTSYSINVFAPNSAQDISGQVTVTGQFAFEGEVKAFKYTPAESGDYTFKADDGVAIRVTDAGGNVLQEGNPQVTVTLNAGTSYNILTSYAASANKSFTLNISK